MTTPDPDPPEPTEPAEPPEPTEQAPTAGDIARLQQSLDEERKARRKAETELAKVQQQTMTDAEKAIADAREEGRASAAAEAAGRLAAAEFRAAAVGKLADPDAALEVLDLAKLVGEDGEPDRKAIAAVVDRLAQTPPANGGGRVPAGPRQPQQQEDFIRGVLHR